VTQIKALHQSCLRNLIGNDGIIPLTNLLKKLKIPLVPTFFKNPRKKVKFDWLEKVVEVQRVLSQDMLIGFDVYANFQNSSANYLFVGAPYDRFHDSG
jgi:Peptidase family M13